VVLLASALLAGYVRQRVMKPLKLLITRRQLLVASVAGTVATASFPQSADRRISVVLERGKAAASFEASISDFEADAYVIPLRRGQSLEVLLATNNASNCFDIHAPGETKPVYVGAESGNTHRLPVQTSGDHVVRVFLLRLAARDGQSARYTLELKLGE
jgi:hypothetical protein